MSINGILSTAVSGLLASQTALGQISNDVANANTPNYGRKQVNQQSISLNGMGAGVTVDVSRVADTFLDAQALTAKILEKRAAADVTTAV